MAKQKVTESGRDALLYCILSETEDRREQKNAPVETTFFICPYEDGFLFGVVFDREYIIKEHFDDRGLLEIFIREDLSPYLRISSEEGKEDTNPLTFEELLVDKIPRIYTPDQQKSDPFTSIPLLYEALEHHPWFRFIVLGTHEAENETCFVAVSDPDIEAIRPYVPKTWDGMEVVIIYKSDEEAQLYLQDD
jgi:hypothetical protein